MAYQKALHRVRFLTGSHSPLSRSPHLSTTPPQASLRECASQVRLSSTCRKGSCANFPFPLPPLEEQRRVVDLLEDHLSRLDAALDRSPAGVNAALRLRARRNRLCLRRDCRDNSRWHRARLEDFAAPPPSPRSPMALFGSNLTSAHYAAGGREGDQAAEYRRRVLQTRRRLHLTRSTYLDDFRATAHQLGRRRVASLGDSLPRAALVPDMGGPAIVKADCIRVRLPGRGGPSMGGLRLSGVVRRKHWAADQSCTALVVNV